MGVFVDPFNKAEHYPGIFFPIAKSTMGQQKITVTFYGDDVVKGEALLGALEASGQQIDSVQMRHGLYDQEMTITFWAKMFAEEPKPAPGPHTDVVQAMADAGML